jgi:hypothetical protein
MSFLNCSDEGSGFITAGNFLIYELLRRGPNHGICCY